MLAVLDLMSAVQVGLNNQYAAFWLGIDMDGGSIRPNYTPAPIATLELKDKW